MLLTVALICTAAAILLSAAGCTASYAAVLRANWEISLPERAQYKEIYEKDSGDSFHGDGIRYHIFSCGQAEYVDAMFTWTNFESPTIFHDSRAAAVEDWLGRIEVPEEWRPDLGACVCWYQSQRDHSEIILCWDGGESLLYVVESFL